MDMDAIEDIEAAGEDFPWQSTVIHGLQKDPPVGGVVEAAGSTSGHRDQPLAVGTGHEAEMRRAAQTQRMLLGLAALERVGGQHHSQKLLADVGAVFLGGLKHLGCKFECPIPLG